MDDTRTSQPGRHAVHRTAVSGVLPGLLLMLVGAGFVWFFSAPRETPPEVDETSEYSHIRIRKRGSVRELLFVRDNGAEARQSVMDLASPHQLLSAYPRRMFASYLFQPEPQRVLIIGLGGGAMVRFLQHYDSDLDVDVVEIDPVVVRLAAEYFETRGDEHVSIMTADGFDFLATTQQRYDVIYFDAFLKPSADTDATGVPQRLKTIAFYESVQEKLRPDGIVAFNLNPHAETNEDLKTIAAAFKHVSTFACPPSRNLVAIATSTTSEPEMAVLQTRAKALDQRFNAAFSFADLLQDRQP